ncbi:hypothetical protein [Bradyrhizobium sp. SZCCHNS3002]|uniref:hypothetical protein n=1 Tax=Bradyrhizobium sp. SZCCHNS3002 TaxID=3057310 RepID=UPI0028ED6A56|nr:hypothetical protein [Bradyrhizobium sp. SZCCHNS3002]
MINIIASVFGFAVFLVTIIGFSFFALDKFLNSQSKAGLKQRVIEFWYRTASLEFYQQFTEAMRSRYSQVRQLRRVFLVAFALVAVAIALLNGIAAFIAPPDQTISYYEARSEQYFKSIIETAISTEINADLTDEWPPDIGLGSTGDQCTKAMGTYFTWVLYSTLEKRASFRRFFDAHRNDKWSIRLFGGVVNFTSLLLYSLPLLIGLLASLNLTVWILSRIVQSKLAFIFILFADLLLAVAVPALLSSVMIVSMVGGWNAALFVSRVSSSMNPSWTTIGLSKIQDDALQNAHSARLVVELASGLFSIAELNVAQRFWQFTAGNIALFFSHLSRVMSFDLAISPHKALVSYAIGIDLLFSLLYVVPCFFLVLMRRSQFSRAIFLNFVQWVAEHPKGVLLALEETCTSFTRYISGIGKR